MKRITVLCLLILIGKFAFSQTAAVSGTVVDDTGKPVPFAFIKDAQHNYQTFSGPDGTFTLNTNPSSSLMATGSGFNKTTVPVDNKTDIKITMQHSNGAGQSVAGKNSDVFDVHELNTKDRESRPLSHFGTAQEELHGSPFLFDHWVHGYAISAKDSLVESNNYLFNYHKIEGMLLYTDDGKTTYGVYKDNAKSFVLFDDGGQQSAFEVVPAIDNKHYLQVLASGSKYKIYKQLNTEFVKADFQTNGIITTGNNYDSYVDQSVYYLVQLPGGQPKKLTLKRKAIKTAFAADGNKISQFLSAHDSDELNDTFLKNLGTFMNN
jgi:hypothetical protein